MEKFANFFRKKNKPELKREVKDYSDAELLALEKKLTDEVEKLLESWTRVRNPSSHERVGRSDLDQEDVEIEEDEKLRIVRRKLSDVKSVIWERGLKTQR